jgi:hypothetical protein
LCTYLGSEGCLNSTHKRDYTGARRGQKKRGRKDPLRRTAVRAGCGRSGVEGCLFDAVQRFISGLNRRRGALGEIGEGAVWCHDAELSSQTNFSSGHKGQHLFCAR